MTTLPEKYVIGVSVRTINEPERAERDIGALWQRVYEEELIDQIPNRADDTVISLYTDYEGDHTQPYTCVIGSFVTTLDEIPEGFVGKKVPASTYQTFPVSGDFPDSLVNKWFEVWESDLPRSYTGDFELYPADFDPAIDSDLTIYIATKG